MIQDRVSALKVYREKLNSNNIVVAGVAAFSAYAAATIFVFMAFVYLSLLHSFASGSVDYRHVFDSSASRAALSPSGFALSLLIATLSIACYRYKRVLPTWLFRYRYGIALALLAVAVIFEINGSSVGMWSVIFGDGDQGNLIGVSRPDRADEWAVSTPMLLSQYRNYPTPFPYFGETLRGSNTDMYLLFGQPVRNIAVIFRPFQLAFLVLPPGQGMAFYWVGRLIALFMVSFEFVRLITNDNRLLALSGAALISFAPTIQWWFATNGLVEMLIFAQLGVLAVYGLITRSETWKRFVWAAVLGLSVGGFIFSLYPAQQIPFGYFILGSIIWVIISNRNKFALLSRFQLIGLIVIELLFLALIVYVLVRSWSTIESLRNTSYPGDRVETGGNGLTLLYYTASNLWLPVFGTGPFANVVESSRFIDFFPIPYLVAGWVLVQRRGRELFTWILLGISLFISIYIVYGFTEQLASISGFGWSFPARIVQILGFINIVMLLRCMSLLSGHLSNRVSLVLASLVALVMVIPQEIHVPGWYPSTVYLLITFVVFQLVCYLILNFNRRWVPKCLAVSLIGIALFSGILVNPVRRGIDSAVSSELSTNIARVVEQDPTALWIVDNQGLPTNNIGISVGARTINSSNMYPDVERWRAFDPTGEYDEIYNRSAHVTIRIEDIAEPEFVSEFINTFLVYLSPYSIRELGVSYVVSDRPLSTLFPADFGLVVEGTGHSIYEVLPSKSLSEH